MSNTKKANPLHLVQGKKYRVKLYNQQRSVSRIFKWTERRDPFGIDCYVFTSKIHPSVTCEVAANGDEITFTGRVLPSSELSVPFYDILSCEAV